MRTEESRPTVVADLADIWQVIAPGAPRSKSAPTPPAGLSAEGRGALEPLLVAGNQVLNVARDAGLALMGTAVLQGEPPGAALIALLSVATIPASSLEDPQAVGLLPLPDGQAALVFPLPVEDLVARVLASGEVRPHRTRTVLELTQANEATDGDHLRTAQLWWAVQDALTDADTGLTLLATALTPCVHEPAMISAVLSPAVEGIRLVHSAPDDTADRPE